eukprot:g186.t1
MVPAVRGLNTTCVDAKNCNYERVTLCAFNLSSTIKGKVDYLDCMDTPWDEELTWKKPFSCAKQQGIDVKQLNDCFSGSLGDMLMKAAVEKMDKQFPKKVFLPQTVVDGTVVDADYDSIKEQACKDGSRASVC